MTESREITINHNNSGDENNRMAVNDCFESPEALDCQCNVWRIWVSLILLEDKATQLVEWDQLLLVALLSSSLLMGLLNQAVDRLMDRWL